MKISISYILMDLSACFLLLTEDCFNSIDDDPLMRDSSKRHLNELLI